MKRLLLLLVLAISFSGKCQLNGNYTVGGVAPDYPTILAAVNDLTTQGVSGNVNIKIRAGIYTEQITLGAIPGASAAAVVTFESETGDSSSVWWKSGSTSISDNFVLKFNNTGFVQIKNLSMKNTGPYGSRILYLTNSTQKISVVGNHLAAPSIFTSNLTRHILLESTNTSDRNLTIDNNNFDLGGYAIQLYGASTLSRDSNIVITNNTINSRYGMYLSVVENVDISHNTINSYYAGVHLINFGTPVNVSHCEIYTSYQNGIRLENNISNDSTFYRTRIWNNRINTRESCFYGGSANLDLYHNTFFCRFDGYGAADVYSNATVKNNIFQTPQHGAFRISNPSAIVASDYNVYYAKNSLISKNGVFYYSLAAWQAASGQDAHSTKFATQFVSATDLHILSSPGAYNSAQTTSWINDDIDGDLRPINADRGADEFDQLLIDGSISSEYSIDTGYVCPGTYAVQVKIINTGLQPLTSAMLQLEVNGVPQAPVSWTGNLPFLDTSAFISLSYNLPQNGVFNFRAWVYNPNGLADPYGEQDTLDINDVLRTKMQGSYTIGAGMYYPTISAAVADLHLRGTCYNVEFLLANGTYFETTLISQVKRTTLFDTLFIRSISGNSTDVVWRSSSNLSASNVLKIEGTSNIHISAINLHKESDSGLLDEIIYAVLSSTGTSLYDSLYNLSIKNCLFTCPDGSGDAILYRGNNLTVDNNRFENMDLAITMDNSSYPYNTFRITNNIFHNQRRQAMMLLNVRNVFIQNNRFTNDFTSYSGDLILPITLTNSSGSLEIAHNRFSGGFTGIMNINHTGTASNRGKIVNNFLSGTLLSFNGPLPIIDLGSTYVDCMHNSLNFVHAPYQWSTGDPCPAPFAFAYMATPGVRVYNNTVKMDSAQCAFGGNVQSNYTADYNNIFIGNLNMYTTASIPGNNVHSTLINPLYYSFNELYPQNNALAGLGTDMGITIDIDSNIRLSPPTIGAVEVGNHLYDINLMNVYAEAHCDSFYLYCDLQNMGSILIDSVWVRFDIASIGLDSVKVYTDFSGSSSMNAIFLGAFPINYGVAQDVYTDVVVLPITDEFQYNNAFDYGLTYTAVPNNLNLGNDTSMCTTNWISFNAGSGFTNYLCNTTETSSSIAVYGPNVGQGVFDYSVEVTDANGCVYTDTISLTVNNCLGIDELTTGLLHVYPNPTVGNCTINIPELHIDKVTIYNLLGEQLSPLDVRINTSIEIDLSNFVSGVYFVEIMSSGKRYLAQVIKE